MNGEKEAVRKGLKIAFASLHFAKVACATCTFAKVDCLDNQFLLVIL